jgi:hypothetical protein
MLIWCRAGQPVVFAVAISHNVAFAISRCPSGFCSLTSMRGRPCTIARPTRCPSQHIQRLKNGRCSALTTSGGELRRCWRESLYINSI